MSELIDNSKFRKAKLKELILKLHRGEKILDDFKSGKASHAPFWINMHGKFILIEYFALRGESGEYLGTLEVSQDIIEARKLKGEQRILSYKSKE